MLLETLGTSMLRNLMTGKGVPGDEENITIWIKFFSCAPFFKQHRDY